MQPVNALRHAREFRNVFMAPETATDGSRRWIVGAQP